MEAESPHNWTHLNKIRKKQMEIKKAKGSTPNHVPTGLGVELHSPLYMRIRCIGKYEGVVLQMVS